MQEQERRALREAAARRLGLAGADEVQLAVVKPLVRTTGPVSQRRRETLRAGLIELAARSSAEAAPEPGASGDEDRASSEVERVCRACRGYCCRHGAEHAHLNADDLKRRRDEFPGRTDADIADLYVGFAPRRAYRGSCIFHAATGCALPRQLRSTICQRFYCSPMDELRARASGEGVTLVVFPEHPARRALLIGRDQAP